MHSKGASKVNMPLNIESGNYTVNPPEKKFTKSKFFLWKNWRRSVHEDQRIEELRGHNKTGRREVAGLGENEDVISTVTLIPNSGGINRASRRTSRPLSLAVQPINYHRLDIDNHQTTTTVKHPNMTSQESIGSCSLDIEKSASDRSEAAKRSLSEKTLYSLNLSCNGSEADKLKNCNVETVQQKSSSPNNQVTFSNGHYANYEPDQLTTKKPSYLGLACSISGYSGITRYDSKLREGFRSRDSSPGTRFVTRDTSPAGFRSSENLNIPSHSHPPKSQSISPLAMEHHNGFTNGLKDIRRIENFTERTNSSAISNQGSSDVIDKGVVSNNTFSDFNPIRPILKSPSKKQNNSQNECYSFIHSSPKITMTNNSNLSFTETNVTNGSPYNLDYNPKNESTNSQKSFIQQRIERLYGPGALAQGFFFKRSSINRFNTSDNSLNKSHNSTNSSLDNSNAEESLKSLPVLRHLRPEFRAQLPVVNARRPTDGSEQSTVIKPLQRLSLSSKKSETKESSVIMEKVKEASLPSKTVKMSLSVTSLTDQQPAAPKVVLPVLESTVTSTTVIKQPLKVEKVKEEDDKDGNYFMNLLEQERTRLLFLAENAEAELNDSSSLPEEAAGKLRSAAGKARLLATQKMHQFMGLCQKNINQVPGEEFPTTNEDLAGFWDMVMLQVVQVNKLFEHIECLRKSEWQEVTSEVKATPGSLNNVNKRRPVSCKVKSTRNEVNRKAQEAREQTRRQMLEEKRRAMRAQNTKNKMDSVEFFIPET